MSTTQHIRQSQTLKETVRFLAHRVYNSEHYIKRIHYHTKSGFWSTVCVIQSFTLREYIIIHGVRWWCSVSAGVVCLQFKVIVRFIIVHRLRLVVLLIAASQTTY